MEESSIQHLIQTGQGYTFAGSQNPQLLSHAGLSVTSSSMAGTQSALNTFSSQPFSGCSLKSTYTSCCKYYANRVFY